MNFVYFVCDKVWFKMSRFTLLSVSEFVRKNVSRYDYEWNVN